MAALTFDAFGLLARAITTAKALDRRSIRDALASVSHYEGVTGAMSFQAGSGDPVKSAVILQIRNGKFVWFANANP